AHRVEASTSGGAQPDGRRRPRGARLAAFRAAQSGGNGRGAGHDRVRGQQALLSCVRAPQGHPGGHARRPGRSLAVNDPPLEFDSMEEAAESFLARYRRGERPSLSEYTAQYPELAERIRNLFRALVLMEKAGSLGGEAGPLATRDGAGAHKVPQQ